jgi:hypothetical protein
LWRGVLADKEGADGDADFFLRKGRVLGAGGGRCSGVERIGISGDIWVDAAVEIEKEVGDGTGSVGGLLVGDAVDGDDRNAFRGGRGGRRGWNGADERRELTMGAWKLEIGKFEAAIGRVHMGMVVIVRRGRNEKVTNRGGEGDVGGPRAPAQGWR